MPRSKKEGKHRLAVRVEPPKGKGFFDIQPPKSHPISGRGGVPMSERLRNWTGSFVVLAVVVYLVLAAVGLFYGGRDFLEENRTVAFAGYEDLQGGLESLKARDLAEARARFAEANRSFTDLSRNLGYLSKGGDGFFKSTSYLDAANRLISLGQLGSDIGGRLVDVAEGLEKAPGVFLRQNSGAGSNEKLTDVLKGLLGRLSEIGMKTKQLSSDLAALSGSSLPAEIRSHLAKVSEPVSRFQGVLDEVQANSEAVLRLLGDRVPHRYLVLLQNNHELRATGGFIGSYMLVDVNDGAVTKLETKDVYESDGQLTEVVPAPPGLSRLSDRLFMRDANYSPDFPTSAQKVMWFLEHSRGPSVDTVIAIDQTLAERLLALTGPLMAPGFPFQIRADNFDSVFSFNIESKQAGAANPKQWLIDFMPVLKEELLSSDKLGELLGLVLDLVAERHIQAYSTDPVVQDLIGRVGMDGRIVAESPKSDFLALVTTAVGGNKSDAFIHTTVDHHTFLSVDGKLVDRVEITKEHTWEPSDFGEWDKLAKRYGTGRTDLKTLRSIQGAGDNLDYLRLYVPKGSRLIGLEGADAKELASTEDLGYSVFGFLFGPVSAGQSKTVTITYELPFSVLPQKNESYRFLAQPQAGSEHVTLKKGFEAANGVEVVRTDPETKFGPFVLYSSIEEPLDRNQSFSASVALSKE